MSACSYCSLEAYNVIEVRYARTIKHASSGVTESEAPREVVGRGYYVCDGCLALLDYRVEHHLDPQKHSVFNLLSSLYPFFAVWLVTALWALAALAGTDDPASSLLQSPGFLTLGILLAFVGLLVWFLRALVHTRYFGTWRAARQKPQTPKNSLAGLTTLRDRANPELGAYLPLRFEDSRKLLKKPGSPALRCIGPNGEPWGQGPATNFSGRGANEWYRLVWISWRLWPLTQILAPEGPEWSPPPEPAVSEIEAACAGLFSAFAFAVFAFTRIESPFFWIIAALICWPVGFFVGRQARELWRDRKIAQSSRPLG